MTYVRRPGSEASVDRAVHKATLRAYIRAVARGDRRASPTQVRELTIALEGRPAEGFRRIGERVPSELRFLDVEASRLMLNRIFKEIDDLVAPDALGSFYGFLEQAIDRMNSVGGKRKAREHPSLLAGARRPIIERLLADLAAQRLIPTFRQALTAARALNPHDPAGWLERAKALTWEGTALLMAASELSIEARYAIGGAVERFLLRAGVENQDGLEGSACTAFGIDLRIRLTHRGVRLLRGVNRIMPDSARRLWELPTGVSPEPTTVEVLAAYLERRAGEEFGWLVDDQWFEDRASAEHAAAGRLFTSPRFGTKSRARDELGARLVKAGYPDLLKLPVELQHATLCDIIRHLLADKTWDPMAIVDQSADSRKTGADQTIE